MVPILLYIGSSSILMLFPANQSQSLLKPSNDTISLTHDFAHVNFMIDLSKSSVDWQNLLPDLVPINEGYLLVGWGEKQVYMTTPTWSDLRASVAFTALMVNTPGTLHLQYLPDAPNQYLEVTPLLLSTASVNTIEQQIFDSFATANYEKSDTPQLLSQGYGTNDQFYYALGKYNLFTTCNTWIGEILNKAKVPISRWTPFSYNVIHSIPPSFKKQK